MICIVLLVGTTSCQDEVNSASILPTEGYFTVEVMLPNHQLPATRAALEDADERRISSMYALVFNAGDDKLLEVQEIDTLSFIPGSTTGRFYFKMEEFSYTQEVYVTIVANVDYDTFIDPLSISETYDDIRLRFKIDAQSDWKRPEEKGEDWQGIPMWGKSIVFVGTKIPTLSIPLMRALAKVEFHYSNTNTTFAIEKIHVYNAARHFYIMPDINNLYSVPDDNKAEKPTIVNNDTEDILDTYLYSKTGNSLRMYLPEQEKGVAYNKSDPSDWMNNLQFILEGTYTYRGGAKTTCYYRIDLNSTNKADGYLDVIRNNAYHIYVQPPTMPGALNLNDARQKEPYYEEDISYTIVCDKGDILHIASVNGVMLGVSRLEFHRDSCKQTITIADEHTNTDATPKTYLKVQCIDEFDAPQDWAFEFVDDDGLPTPQPNWILDAQKEGDSELGGIKIELASAFHLAAENVVSRTANINVHTLDDRLNHTIKVVQYNQPFIKDCMHPKQKKYWLVNHLQGKGVVIQPATPWRSKLLEDDHYVVKEIRTLSSMVEKQKTTFFIRLVNGWNETNPDKQYPYESTDVTALVRFQSTLDPALYTDFPMQFFGLLKRHGFYISIAQPDATHFNHDIHGVFEDHNWYHANNQYDFDYDPSGFFVGRPRGIYGEAPTGCPALGLGPDGEPWRLPTPGELDKIFLDLEEGETREEFDDKIMNFWHTIARWGGEWYLDQVDWAAERERGNPNGSIFYQAVSIGHFTRSAGIYLYPENTKISTVKQYDYGEEHKMGIFWDTNRNKSTGREYFCISKSTN